MKAKQILVTFVTLLVGYVLGGLVGFPPSLDALSGGDISKANKFNKAIESPELEAFKEKLLSDTTEMKKTVITVALLNARIQEFDTLTTMAIQAAEGKQELDEAICRLEGVKQLAENAHKSGQMAQKSLDALLTGKKSPDLLPYDQASQNMVLAYLLLNNQNDAGKEFVQAADAYLQGKNIEEHQELVNVREMWALYCAASAVLNEDKSEMAYWSETQSLMAGKNTLGSDVKVQTFELGNKSSLEVLSNSKFSLSNNSDIAKEGIYNHEFIKADLQQATKTFQMDVYSSQTEITANIEEMKNGISGMQTNNLQNSVMAIDGGLNNKSDLRGQENRK